MKWDELCLVPAPGTCSKYVNKEEKGSGLERWAAPESQFSKDLAVSCWWYWQMGQPGPTSQVSPCPGCLWGRCPGGMEPDVARCHALAGGRSCCLLWRTPLQVSLLWSRTQSDQTSCLPQSRLVPRPTQKGQVTVTWGLMLFWWLSSWGRVIWKQENPGQKPRDSQRRGGQGTQLGHPSSWGTPSKIMFCIEFISGFISVDLRLDISSKNIFII